MVKVAETKATTSRKPVWKRQILMLEVVGEDLGVGIAAGYCPKGHLA